ncbi:uncharacterized protein METZ01_LOCUS157863, partial [marine metagenome]
MKRIFTLLPCLFFLNAGIRSQDLCPLDGISVTGGDEENIIYWGDWQDFTETFDTELPDDWTVINSGTAPDYSWNWTQPTGTQSIDGTPYMRVDSDAAGTLNDFLDEELITPVINSEGMSGLYLVFDHYYNNISIDQAYVDVWDGDDWVTVASFTADIGAWNAPDQQVLDLSDYANSELQVRFHYIDNGVWAWYWAIDNVVISATSPGERSVYTYTLTEFGWDMNTLSKEELIEKYPASGGPYSIVDESSIEEHIVNTRDIPEECGTFSIYRVYDATDNSIIGETTELSYTHASLTNGQEYCYYVTVVYDEGESEGTDTECGTPASPVPEATISLDNVFGLPGDTVVVGVDIEMENDYSINSYEMTFGGFGNFAVELLGVETSGTLTEQFDWMISINDLDSSVTVAAAGDAEMTYGGTLLQLRFAIDSDAQGAEIPITAYDILLNEDYASADTNSGSIVIPEGCTDNYVAIFCDYGSDQAEVSWVLVNSDGDSVAAGGAPYESNFCLPSSAYTLLMYDSFGDGWNGNMWGIYDYIADSIVVSLTLESGTEGSEIFLLGDAEHVLGCMDPDAINYNEDATQDDGSCLYNGDLCSAAIEAAEGDAGNQADGDDEWFYFTATMDGYITVTTCYDNQPE